MSTLRISNFTKGSGVVWQWFLVPAIFLLLGIAAWNFIGPEVFVPASAKLVGRTDPLFAASSKVKAIDGYYDVFIHGEPNSFSVLHNGEWVKIDHRSLSTYLGKSDYNGEAVRLISCSTGACETGIAQDLSNKLGVEVIAPSDTAWIHPSGKMSIGKTPIRNTGQWNQFNPKINLQQEIQIEPLSNIYNNFLR